MCINIIDYTYSLFLGLDSSGKTTLTLTMKKYFNNKSKKHNKVIPDDESDVNNKSNKNTPKDEINEEDIVVLIPPETSNVTKTKICYAKSTVTVIDPPGNVNFRCEWDNLFNNSINDIIFFIDSTDILRLSLACDKLKYVTKKINNFPKLSRLLILLTKCEKLNPNTESRISTLIKDSCENVFFEIQKCDYSQEFFNRLILWLLGISYTL